MSFWCEHALMGGAFRPAVRIEVGPHGRISALHAGAPKIAADIEMGVVITGFANAHSHLFHRVLRGRTNAGGGDFWQWRDSMYQVAAALDPERYRRLAVAVFTEMLAAGYTAVGEFHYVHHQPDGTPYPDHAMEIALADAADEAGIRLTLLDTCYLSGGIGAPLSSGQVRFGDKTAAGWLDRWYRLRAVLRARPGSLVTLGAAIHSVRAVSDAEIRCVVEGLPSDIALHVHLSEQPQENADCLRTYGVTPTGLLNRLGALSGRVTVVHATHLAGDDIAQLGRAGVSAAFCPTTEADLGDGIGPGRVLADAGVALCIGSDQNAVVDPLLELRGLEAGERLASGTRGVFAPSELWLAGTANGYRSLGHGTGRPVPGLAVGDLADLVELDGGSTRTVGSRLDQLVLSATSADVRRTVVGGSLVPPVDPARLLADALRGLDLASAPR